MTRALFAAYLLGIQFCQTGNAQTWSKGKYLISTSKKQHPNAKYNSCQSDYSRQTALLQGIWTDCSNCNALFTIKGQRVIYFDSRNEAKNDLIYWKISSNELSFDYGKGLVVTDAIVKLTKDSLILYRKDIGTTRLSRMK